MGGDPLRFVRPSVVVKDGDVKQGGEQDEEVKDFEGCGEEMTLGSEEDMEGPMSGGTEEPGKLDHS